MQQSASSVRTAKCTLKEFEEVSEVSNTSPKAIWSFLKTATRFFASLAAAPLFFTHQFRRGLHGVVAAFWLCFRFRFRSSLFLTRFHYSFLPFWRRRDNETASAATALKTINLRKCTQLFVNRTFLNGTEVCAQATPLIAFLKQDRSEATARQPRAALQPHALRRSAKILSKPVENCIQVRLKQVVIIEWMDEFIH